MPRINSDEIQADHPILWWNFRQAKGHLMTIEEELNRSDPEIRKQFRENAARLEELGKSPGELDKNYTQTRGHLLSVSEHLINERTDLAPHMWCRVKHWELADVGHVQTAIGTLDASDREFAAKVADWRAQATPVLEKPELRPSEVEVWRRKWDEIWGFNADLKLWNSKDLADVGHLQEVGIYSGDVDSELTHDMQVFSDEFRELFRDPDMPASRMRNSRNRLRHIFHDVTLPEYSAKAAECKLCSKDTGTKEGKEIVLKALARFSLPADTPEPMEPPPVEPMEPVPAPVPLPFPSHPLWLMIPLLPPSPLQVVRNLLSRAKA